MVGLEHYLTVAAALFVIFGADARRICDESGKDQPFRLCREQV